MGRPRGPLPTNVEQSSVLAIFPGTFESHINISAVAILLVGEAVI